MYGLPGNANSRRLNRNATETRVHNFWNHLVETASHSTGSLLIWDTGTYNVLPHPSKSKSKSIPAVDPDSQNQSDQSSSPPPALSSPSPSSPSSRIDLPTTSLSEPEKLAQAFENRKICLRLNGTKLPKNYTVMLRLNKEEDRVEQPARKKRRRRRKDPNAKVKAGNRGRKFVGRDTSSDSGSDDDEYDVEDTRGNGGEAVNEVKNDERGGRNEIKHKHKTKEELEREAELEEIENEAVRLSNAYTGAHNSIGSIHQRRWYLSLDRVSSGFVKVGNEWVRRMDEDSEKPNGFETFFVRGKEVERSVVTGRRAEDVLRDEGVAGYVGRRGWRAVME